MIQRGNTVDAHGLLNRTPAEVSRPVWRHLLPVFLACLFLVCGCHVWKAYESVKDVRQEIAAERDMDMHPESLYHLNVAEGLLDAAEKQYEDADFTSSSRLARQASDHLDRSRKLRAFRDLVEKETAGGAP